MSNSSTSRGNRTRAARKQFITRYGSLAAGIVRMLASGYTTDKVVEVSGAPRGTVAAFKANLTRGTYAPYVSKNGTGTCNFRS